MPAPDHLWMKGKIVDPALGGRVRVLEYGVKSAAENDASQRMPWSRRTSTVLEPTSAEGALPDGLRLAETLAEGMVWPRAPLAHDLTVVVGHLECANCGRDVSEVEDARTSGLRVFCCRRCFVFSSRTREVPPWGKEHAVAWADPWEDLSSLSFAELAEILHLCLLDFARARKDVEMSRLRGSEGGGQSGALDRLAAARQLTERVREVPAYYDVSPAELAAYGAKRRHGVVDGGHDVELVRVPGDSLARPFVPAVCVVFLATHPLEAPDLIARVDRLGPQAVLERVSHHDAENLVEALERFGFTTNIRESPAEPASHEPALREEAQLKAIAADVRRVASRQDGR